MNKKLVLIIISSVLLITITLRVYASEDLKAYFDSKINEILGVETQTYKTELQNQEKESISKFNLFLDETLSNLKEKIKIKVKDKNDKAKQALIDAEANKEKEVIAVINDIEESINTKIDKTIDPIDDEVLEDLNTKLDDVFKK